MTMSQPIDKEAIRAKYRAERESVCAQMGTTSICGLPVRPLLSISVTHTCQCSSASRLQIM